MRYYRRRVRSLAKYPTPGMGVDELFDGIVDACANVVYVAVSHMDASNGSSLWSSDVVGFLAASTGGESRVAWNETLSEPRFKEANTSNCKRTALRHTQNYATGDHLRCRAAVHRV